MPEVKMPGHRIQAFPSSRKKRIDYSDTRLPDHYSDPSSPLGDVAGLDNTPENNPITNEGATLGRVLFYDKRLSANDSVSCASCHQQEHGFSDPERFSKGYSGQRTRRRAMGLTNARYYESGRFFWDERATTLEELVYDQGFAQGRDGYPNFRWIYTEQEKLGLRLFATIPGDSWISLRCDRCHKSSAHVGAGPP